MQRFLSSLVLALCVIAAPAFADPVGSAFTYQGQLTLNDAPATGNYDFKFDLYTFASGGSPVTSVPVASLAVTGGLVDTALDFTDVPFNGAGLWIEVSVRPAGAAGGYTTLSPRQKITATPYALFALNGNPGAQGPAGPIGPAGAEGPIGMTGATGPVGAAGPAGPTGAAGSTGPAGPAGSPGPVGPIGATGSVGATGPAGATGAQGAPGAAGPAGPAGIQGTPGSADAWGRLGNAGTTPGTNFIGTTNQVAFDIRTGNVRAVRYESTSGVTNILGGYAQNSASTGLEGTTIAGGGSYATNGANLVTGNFGAIGGGYSNTAADTAVVAGGTANQALGSKSTIGGGLNNLTAATATQATVAGGSGNQAQGIDSSVGGGLSNAAAGNYAVIAGGQANSASAPNAAVLGGMANQASGSYAVVAGGRANQATGMYSGIGGGATNVASGDSAFAIGTGNIAGGSASFAGGYGSHVRSAAESGTPTGDAGTFMWVCDACNVTASTGTDQFIVMATGGVGINTASPGSFALAVNGTAAKPGGGSWSVFSDVRLKKNVQPLEHTLDRVLQLHGRQFEYIDPKASFALPGVQTGFIAQDVEKIFPDWVGEDGRGYKFVSVHGFEALTVEALRDLRDEKDDEIASLKTELAALRSEKDEDVAAMRADIRSMRQQIAGH